MAFQVVPTGGADPAATLGAIGGERLASARGFGQALVEAGAAKQMKREDIGFQREQLQAQERMGGQQISAQERQWQAELGYRREELSATQQSQSADRELQMTMGQARDNLITKIAAEDRAMQEAHLQKNYDALTMHYTTMTDLETRKLKLEQLETLMGFITATAEGQRRGVSEAQMARSIERIFVGLRQRQEGNAAGREAQRALTSAQLGPLGDDELTALVDEALPDMPEFGTAWQPWGTHRQGEIRYPQRGIEFGGRETTGEIHLVEVAEKVGMSRDVASRIEAWLDRPSGPAGEGPEYSPNPADVQTFLGAMGAFKSRLDEVAKKREDFEDVDPVAYNRLMGARAKVIRVIADAKRRLQEEGRVPGQPATGGRVDPYEATDALMGLEPFSPTGRMPMTLEDMLTTYRALAASMGADPGIVDEPEILNILRITGAMPAAPAAGPSVYRLGGAVPPMQAPAGGDETMFLGGR